MNLKLDESYFAFVLSAELLASSYLKAECRELKASYVHYYSPEMNLYVFSHYRHAEPLLELASGLMENTSLEVFVGARILQTKHAKRRNQVTSDVVFFDYEGLKLPKNFDQILEECPKSFGVYLLIGEKLCLIYPSVLWEKAQYMMLRLLSSLDGQRFLVKRIFERPRLVSYSRLTPRRGFPAPRKLATYKRKYDPIIGRVSEARNWCNHNIQQSKGISSSLESVRLELDCKEKLLEYLSNLPNELIQELKKLDKPVPEQTKQSTSSSVFPLVDVLRFERLLAKSDIVIEKISSMTSRIVQKQNKRSLSIIEPHIFLRCVNVVLADLLDCMGLPSNSLVVIPEYQSMSPHLTCLGVGRTEFNFLVFPMRFLHRLGLYPLIANCIPEFAMFHQPSIKMNWDRLQAKAMEAVDKIVEVTKQMNPNVRREDLELDLIEAYMNVFNDLIGAFLMGPAYIYALYRRGIFFSAPNSQPQTDIQNFAVASRIKGIEEILKRLGVGYRTKDIAEISGYEQFALDRKAMSLFYSLDLPRMIDEIFRLNIPKRYSSERHAEATGTVKENLKTGKLCKVDSILLLNALWDAVFDTKGYANEMAVLFSLLWTE